MWMNSLQDNINNDFRKHLLSYIDFLVRLCYTTQYLVCMSCDAYQPTNLENVLPLRYTNVILYLYVVCLGMMYKDRKVLGIYTNKCKRSMEQASSSISRSQDSRGDSQMNCRLWFWIQLFVLLGVISPSACFLNRKKVALKCKDIPSHSRLRMNSFKNLVILKDDDNNSCAIY